jgi:RNA polymerase sigma factor (sigma-70 family)
MESDHISDNDALVCFFRDVASMPIVTGKSQYLLLTRRIQRARLLKRLTAENASQTLQRVRSALNKTLKKFNHQCEARHVPFLSLETLSIDVELFLNDASLRVPPVLGQYGSEFSNSDQNEDWHETGWRCFYLMSLLPVPVRNKVDSTPPLDEVTAYFENIIKEGEIAKQELIEGTLRYVLRVARLYLESGIPYLDLVQEGFLGLFRAVETFDERLGAHFQSHAANWIRQRITRYIVDNARLIRVPVHLQEEFSQIRPKEAELIEKTGHLPTDNDLFLALEWLTPTDIQLLNRIAAHDRALRVKLRLKEHSDLLEYTAKTTNEIPYDVLDKVTALADKQSELKERLGRTPETIEVIRSLGWINDDEISLLNAVADMPPVSDKQRAQLQTKLRKAHTRMRYYRIAMAKHHSFESEEIRLLPDEEYLPLDDFLASEDSVEKQALRNVWVSQVQRALSRLGDREREIVDLRYGLSDGQEKTLEEIGQIYGLTRERVRQIEAKALRKLNHPAVSRILRDAYESGADRVSYDADRLRTILKNALWADERIYDTTDVYFNRERERVERLTQRYIMGGRKRVGGARRRGERAEVFRQLLEESGTPLHHTEIHQRSLTRLPSHLHFSPKTTYATLFQNDWFRSFGSGVFGLSSWGNSANGGRGDHVFIHCPAPLLPANASSRAFFESIMLGRDLLSRRGALNVQTFYTEMLAWARQPVGSIQDAQGAFDAWYAAGLLERIDFLQNRHTSLTLTISTDARLNEVRIHCLNHLCRRILRTPELLLALERIALPTTAILQRAIFGSEHAGFDLPIRLTMLAAFEAVSRVGNVWRLTDVGRTVLETNPPEELPDFGEIETASEEESLAELEWEDEFGLLDL